MTQHPNHTARPAPSSSCQRQGGQRGAALLLAMVILTLVSTLAASMVWQQSRAIHIEAAERARVQLGWMLNSGIDFARETIRRLRDNDPRDEQVWDAKVEETRLSSLLAADRDNNADTALEAFISGHISDAHARYNLRRLLNPQGEVVAAEAKTLLRLCDAIGLPGTEQILIAGLQKAWAPLGAERSPDASVAIRRPEQLAWLGLDAATVARLIDFVDVLPASDTGINLNTAPREVIYAVIDGIDLATAGRLVRERNNRFATVEDARKAVSLNATIDLGGNKLVVKSRFFYAEATVRFEDRAVTERALLERQGDGGSATVLVRRSDRQPVRTP